MAKKIVKGVGGLFGLKKKRPKPAEEQNGPTVIALGPDGRARGVGALRSRQRQVSAQVATILEDRLGGLRGSKLGG